MVHRVSYLLVIFFFFDLSIVLAASISRANKLPILTEKIGDQPRIKVWPQPQSVTLGDKANVGVIPKYKTKFQFQIQHAFTDLEKQLLTKAFNRYSEIIFYDKTVPEQPESICTSTAITCIFAVNVFVKSTSPEIELQFGADETYTIQSSKNSLDITSNTVWGALHALETISQLIILSDPKRSPAYALEGYNLPIAISDGPRFSWRGLLIDTSRHYLTVNKIKHAIDSLSYIKMNVLHWHVVDDQVREFCNIHNITFRVSLFKFHHFPS
jgi:hexosaminidase